MSHELRTPMNAILGFSQLMQRDSSLKPEQRDYLKIISRSGSHLLGLINEVLEISKIEAKRITLDPTPFDLHALLRDLEIMFRMRTNAKGISLTYSGLSDIPHYIISDQNKLRQVLINLLGNAVKFTDTGGVTTLFSTKRSDDGDTLLQISIIDTGSGIAEDEQDLLFRYFEQTASGRKTKSGTGLGLAISRDYIQLMGGDITVSSQVGNGSVFTVVLPVQTVSRSDIHDPEENSHVLRLASDINPPRVLIVEDNEENRLFLATLLKETGFFVKTAINGKIALDVVAEWHPDFIWMDIRMPEMDGIEATRILKRSPNSRSTIIVALTASAFEEDRKKISEVGFDEFVRKPFMEGEIFDMMARFLPIRYIRHEGESEGTDQGAGNDLTPTMLRSVPESLREQLHEAVIRLDRIQITEAIDAISQYYPDIGTAISSLADSLDFDQLLQMLENAEINPESAS